MSTTDDRDLWRVRIDTADITISELQHEIALRRVCTHCHEGESPTRPVVDCEDRYKIYAGRWHAECWDTHGYGGYVFDPAYAGEHLDEED